MISLAETFATAMNALGENPPSLAVAVSGGADSMALALLAAEWAASRDIPLQTFTVDHGLRAEAAAEAAQVQAWLTAHGIAHRTLHWQPPHQLTANIQAQARDARYRLLAEACAASGIQHLLTGHHQDDQAETFLLRLQRGSGVDGLAAMRPVSRLHGLTLLRPLLGISKSTLCDFLDAREQSWLEDPSNHSLRHNRTKMRSLMPALAEAGITAATLADTAPRLARASDYLRQQTAIARAECLTLHPEGYISIDIAAYRTLHEEIALRVLADVLRLMNHDSYRTRFSELEALHHHLPETRTLGHCQFRAQRGKILVFRETAHIAAPLTLYADRPTLWDGRFLLTLKGADSAIVEALGTPLPESVQHSPLPKRILHGLPLITPLENAPFLPHMLSDAMPHPVIHCEIRPFPFADSGQL